MTFDQRHLVDVIAMAARLRGGRALLVGGYVRDSIMGRESKDVDIEVFGVAPDALKEMLEQVSGGSRRIASAPSFGVYKIGDVDVSIPRRDSKQRAGHKGSSSSAIRP
jgi:tRNA nucleotidyltransferase (CCA-adding enzyme)